MENIYSVLIVRVKHITIFREELATSALAGFRTGPSWLNGNLEMLVSVKRGKPDNPPKKIFEARREPATHSTHK